MASRLYPNTHDVAVLERLIDVPPGTHAKLKAIEARQKTEMDAVTGFHEKHELGYKHYQETLNTNEGRMEAFILSGWGKTFRDVCPDYSGGETDPVKVQEILDAHHVNRYGVSLEEMGGVHWC